MASENVEVGPLGLRGGSRTSTRPATRRRSAAHIERFFHPDCVLSAGPEVFVEGTWSGHDGIFRFMTNQLEAFQGMWIEPLDFVEAGEEWLVVPIRFGGTARHTGMEITLSPVHVFRLADGRATEFQIFRTRRRRVQRDRRSAEHRAVDRQRLLPAALPGEVLGDGAAGRLAEPLALGGVAQQAVEDLGQPRHVAGRTSSAPSPAAAMSSDPVPAPAIVGTPADIASMCAAPKPSWTLGITWTWPRASSARASSCGSAPVKRTRSADPELAREPLELLALRALCRPARSAAAGDFGASAASARITSACDLCGSRFAMVTSVGLGAFATGSIRSAPGWTTVTPSRGPISSSTPRRVSVLLTVTASAAGQRRGPPRAARARCAAPRRSGRRRAPTRPAARPTRGARATAARRSPAGTA